MTSKLSIFIKKDKGKTEHNKKDKDMEVKIMNIEPGKSSVVVLNAELMAAYGIQGGGHDFVTVGIDPREVLDMLLQSDNDEMGEQMADTDSETRLAKQWAELELRLAFVSGVVFQ